MSSMFDQDSVFQLIAGTFSAMGRTYGPDLVVPNIYRHQLSHPQQQMSLQRQQQLFEAHFHQHLMYRQRHPHLQYGFEALKDGGRVQGAECSGYNSDSQEASEAPESSDTTGDGHSRHTDSACKRNGREADSPTSSQIKFSIERILSGNINSRRQKDAASPCVEEVLEGSDAESASGGEDEDVTDTQQFDWLQCTRYKPPKLQRMSV